MNRFMTPPIPEDIRELSCTGYTNIFELGLGNRNLYGTETLLGDWNGALLIVAKDFAPVDQILALVGKGIREELIYCHNDGDGRYQTGLRTNTRLLRLIYGPSAAQMLNGQRNLDCGALYISASFFMKGGNDGSSSLTGWRQGSEPFDKSGKVFKFVLSHMPNLRAVACLGSDAERLVRANVESSSQLVIGKLRHPSRGSNEELQAEWCNFMGQAGLYANGASLSAAQLNDGG